jgi:hypothetical protein
MGVAWVRMACWMGWGAMRGVVAESNCENRWEQTGTFKKDRL